MRPSVGGPEFRRHLPHQVAASAAAAFVVLVAGLRHAEADETISARRPNIVFILADELGWADLGCYGSRYHRTPRIDRMAAEGLRFTDGYTCGPNCQPTRAALMSGQYGPRTGVYTVGGIDRFDWKSRPLRPVDNVVALPPGKVTLAQSLKKAGYATAMFGKWHLGETGDQHPGRRGFDEAIVSMGRHFDFATSPKSDVPAGAYLADFLTDKAVDFVRRKKDAPFFLYLPHFGVHSPYQAKKDKLAQFENVPAVGGQGHAVYAAMLASVDESVGRVLDELDKLDLSRKTLVIFSSDNGGVGGYVREGIRAGHDVTDNAPLRGGKGMLYEGGVRVPYVFRWPGTISAGTSGVPINSVDLYPTLLELAGARAPEGYVLDGTSYAQVLKSGGSAGSTVRNPLFWHFPGYLGAGEGTWRTTPVGTIRQGQWKLLEFFETGKVELYDLSADIGERQDRTQEMPEKTAELKAKLAAWRESVHAKLPTPNTEKTKPAAPADKPDPSGKKKAKKKS